MQGVTSAMFFRKADRRVIAIGDSHSGKNEEGGNVLVKFVRISLKNRVYVYTKIIENTAKIVYSYT